VLAEAYFWIFAGIATLCGCGVLFSRHPIGGAVNLIGVMMSLAGIYALLAGPFLAIVQLLVYAGAIMMLVVFVIMVLGGATDRRTPMAGLLFLPALLLAAGVAALAIAVHAQSPLVVDATAKPGEIKALGELLFAFGEESGGWYLLFEAIGLVLLAALTGAVLMAKRSLSSPEPAGDVAVDDEEQHAPHDDAAEQTHADVTGERTAPTHQAVPAVPAEETVSS